MYFSTWYTAEQEGEVGALEERAACQPRWKRKDMAKQSLGVEGSTMASGVLSPGIRLRIMHERTHERMLPGSRSMSTRGAFHMHAQDAVGLAHSCRRYQIRQTRMQQAVLRRS